VVDARKRASRTRGSRRQIGEVAEQVKLSLRALRYYDEVGVVSPSARTQGGFRLYTDEDVERLLLVKCMKPLEFTLDEMRDLLSALDAHRRREDSAIGLPSADRESLDELQHRLARYRGLLGSRVEALTTQLTAAQRLSRELDARLEAPPTAVRR
jgi:DNA-binding transcriptional MerR regulator